MNTNDKLADWVMVPRVATKEMAQAMTGWAPIEQASFEARYTKMLAAAPAPAVGGEHSGEAYGNGYNDGYHDAMSVANDGVQNPVAWRGLSADGVEFEDHREHCEANPEYWEPLYTHPLKEQAPAVGDAISPCLGCDSLACDDCRRRAINESEVAMDAERYRWLRDKACFGSRHDPAVLKDGPTDCCEFMFGEELDAAIDAAIAAQAGGE